MAKKLVAVFLMGMVVLAAMHINNVEAGDLDEYKECVDTCHKECFQDGKGQGYTYCEMKCDGECGVKAVKAKFSKLMS